MRFLATLVGIFLSSLVLAGTYTVTYTGGSATWTGPNGPGGSHAYSLGSDGYYGIGAISTGSATWPQSSGTSGPGTVTCSGLINVHLTWVKAFASDEPPTHVIIRIDSDSAWAGDSGACADAFGTDEDIQSDGGSSQSVHHIVSAGGSTVDFFYDPNSTATLNVQGQLLAASASVRIKLTATPVVITPIGSTTRPTDGSSHFLVGQKAAYSVSAGSYHIVNPRWANKIHALKDINISGDLSTRTSLALQTGDYLTSTPNWYYDQPGKERVSILIDVYTAPGGTFIGQAVANKILTIWVPWHHLEVTIVPFDHFEPNASNPNKFLSDYSDWQGAVGTPSLFSSGNQWGQWGFVQTVNLYFQTSGIDVLITDDPFELDNSYPYDDPIWYPAEIDANGDAEDFSSGDQPRFGLMPLSMTAEATFTARLFQCYEAPANGNGPSRGVPLHQIDWEWMSVASTGTPVWTEFGYGTSPTGFSAWEPMSVAMDWNDLLLNPSQSGVRRQN